VVFHGFIISTDLPIVIGWEKIIPRIRSWAYVTDTLMGCSFGQAFNCASVVIGEYAFPQAMVIDVILAGSTRVEVPTSVTTVELIWSTVVVAGVKVYILTPSRAAFEMAM
jgi:hypothetical protein